MQHTNPEMMSAAERRRVRMRQEMRAQILAGARRLLDARGVEALTMRAVADEIGYSTGAIYEYFRSKDDLCAALFFQGSEGLTGRMDRAVADLPLDAGVRERIAASGSAYRQFALDNPDLYLLIFGSMAPTAPPSADELSEANSFQTLLDLVAEGTERGELAPTDPARAATVLWAFVHGFVMLELTGHLPDQPEGVRDEMFDAGGSLMIRGLVAQAGNGTA